MVLLQVKKLTSNLDLVKDVMRGEITTYTKQSNFVWDELKCKFVLLGLSEFLLKPAMFRTLHFNTLFLYLFSMKYANYC